jgi:hypothetical protein
MNQKYADPSVGRGESGDSVIGNWIFKQSKVILIFYGFLNHSNIILIFFTEMEN